ncbi:MAG: NADH-quinone oxidoreductase subunit H, partial [Verrucomicrobia bacterium]|nr:NADH-quinone oxidoreductase subunit H [Verrucomicrobiota bacterium]
MDFLDQLPVALKHWLVGLCPVEFQWLVSIALSIVPILAVFPLLFGIVTVIERKGLGRIQNRYGPNRVGIPFTDIRLFGFGQFIADGIKMLTKEDIVPRAADKVVHFLAPVVIMIPALLAFAVLPYGRNMTPLDLDTGLLFFFAVGASTELCVFMAGWSSRNKYSLLGAMRAIAQMVSYELPLLLSTITAVMIAGSLAPARIVDAQAGYTWGLANWFVFTPWGFAGFLIFLTAATAEANRSPFDMPEAESELVAGYFTEYSGFKFALFFLGEYLGLFAMSGLGITLFLGGWHAPIEALEFVPSWCWFFVKLFALIALFIWVRGTVPRLRAD